MKEKGDFAFTLASPRNRTWAIILRHFHMKKKTKLRSVFLRWTQIHFAFTLNTLLFNHLPHKGEEVKAKYRKQQCAHYARGAIRRHESSPHGALFSLPFPPRKKRLALPAKKCSGFLTAWRASLPFLARVCTAHLAFCVEKTSTKLVRHRIIRIFAANYP